MNKTAIEYLDYTWNPIAMRCTPTTEGCTNCWHLTMAKRMANNPKIAPEIREAYAGDHEPVLIESRLDEPERRRKSSIIGVQFMGDLFHEAILFSTISLVMKTVLNCPRHTFVFLTKRPQRMAEYFKWAAQNSNLIGFQPPSNAWIGVTAENQKAADERIPILPQIPAAVRFVSYEPALGPINLIPYLANNSLYKAQHYAGELNFRGEKQRDGSIIAICNDGTKFYDGTDLHLVIAGCESGPKRRPAKVDWFRSIRDQCIEAGVPFFLKQMEIGSKVVSMPELDGKIWKEWPK